MPRIKTRTEGGDFGGGFVGGGGGSIDGGGGNIGGGDYGGGGSLSEADLRRWFKNHFEKDEVYQMICDQANLSVFERKCFSQYWYAKGLMILTLDEWEGISEVTDTTGYKTGVPIKRRAMKFYKKVVSFYSYAEYDYALGSSTITFTENGIPVGLRDSYDFNMFANRSLKAEAVTISMSILGKLYGGQDYEIYYGVY